MSRIWHYVGAVLGCGGILVLGGLILWSIFGRGLFIGLGLIFGVVLYAWASRCWRRKELVRQFRRLHGPKDLLLVYTDSPSWGPYIQEHWIPRWQDRVVTLNRSRRWSKDRLESRLWTEYNGSGVHTPLALVIPAHKKVTVIHLWNAFTRFKDGDDTALREAELQIENALEESIRIDV